MICFYFSIEIIEIIGVCFVLHVLFHAQNHVVPYGMLERGGLEKERVVLLHNCPIVFDVVHLEWGKYTWSDLKRCLKFLGDIGYYMFKYATII